MIRKLFSVLTLSLMCSFCLKAQTTMFSSSSLTPESLDELQSDYYARLNESGKFKSLQIVDYNAEAIFDSAGIITFSVGNFLDSIAFKSSYVDIDSSGTVHWAGKFFADSTGTIVAAADMSMIQSSDFVMASINSGRASFHIYDLAGVLVLAEFDRDAQPLAHCGNNDEEDSTPLETMSTGPCSTDKLKILFVFTEDALYHVPGGNTLGFAMMSLFDFNLGRVNSEIANGATAVALAGVEVVDAAAGFLPNIEESNAFQLAVPKIVSDRNKFCDDADLAALRDEKKADIVIIITAPAYVDDPIFGGAVVDGMANILPWDRYKSLAIVTTERAYGNNRYVFAHEIAHILGARHETGDLPGQDNTLGDAHAQIFRPIWGLFSGKRATIVKSVPDDEEFILHYSNPYVNYMGSKTGKSYERDNARHIRDNIPAVGSFYSDYVTFVPTVQMNGPANCMQTGTATAIIPEECDGSYTYEWSYSDNGTSWMVIANSNTATIPTFVPMPGVIATPFGNIIMPYNTRQYRVKVTRTHLLTTQTRNATGTAVYQCMGVAEWFEMRSALNVKQQNGLSISPNPIDNSFTLNFVSEKLTNATIDLYDMSGKKVRSLYAGNIDAGANQFNFKRDFAAGTYVVSLLGEGISLQGKLIAK